MASQLAYTIACIELYSRLWAQLEALGDAAALDAARLDAPLQILRLELHLLLQACDGVRWRGLLANPQRLALKSILQEVLLMLGAHEPAAMLPAAQNRLLDAVLDRCADTPGLVHPMLLRAASS